MKILLSLGLLDEYLEEEDKAKIAIVYLFLNGLPSDQRLFDAVMSTNLEGIVSVLDRFGKFIDFGSVGKGVEFNISAKYALFLDVRGKLVEGKEDSKVSTVILEFHPLRIKEDDKILQMMINAIEVREGEFVTMVYLSNPLELVQKPSSRF
jgi:hypothetical protein